MNVTWVDRAINMLAWLALAAVMIAALATGADVVLRHLVGAGLRGLIDLVQLCMMYAVFLSIAYGFARQSHVAVTVLTEVMSARMNRILASAWWLAGACLLGVLAYGAFGQAHMVVGYGDVSQNINIPMFWYWLPVVVGLALSIIASLFACLQTFRGTTNRATGAIE